VIVNDPVIDGDVEIVRDCSCVREKDLLLDGVSVRDVVLVTLSDIEVVTLAE